MFGSRKKGKKQYTPPTAATVDPSAATAALSAYNLSSAAATAALRALPATPTNVAAVQTKRTLRRSASVSSQGSRRALSPVPSIKRVMGFGGGAGNGGDARVASPVTAPSLRRRGSSSSLVSMSSMTERTFRAPSPHRLAGVTSSPNGSVNSSRSLPVNAAGAAAATAVGRSAAAAGGGAGFGNRSRSMPPPPVPSIPKHVIASGGGGAEPKPKSKQQQQQQQGQRKATTLGLVQQPLHLASQKQKEGRSSWFGSAAVGNLSDIRTADAAMNINNYASTAADGRPDSRNSVNFSYPSRQRLGSPNSSPTLTRASLAEPASSTVSLPPATTPVRAASTERAPKQQSASQQKLVASAARRSASTSRVVGRSSSDQTLVYDPNSRRMVPRAELLMLEQSILDAAEKPQRQERRRKQQQGTSTASLAGSHLAQGTVTKAHGTAAPLNRSELQHAQEQQRRRQQGQEASGPAPPEQRQPKKTAVKEPPVQHFAQPVAERDFEEPAQPVPALSTSTSTPSSSVSSLTALAASQQASQQTTSPIAIQNQSPSDDTGYDGTYSTEDGRPTLVKRPSIVREDPEREEEEEQKHHQRTKQPQLSAAAAAATAAAATAAAAAGSRTALDDLDGVPTRHTRSGQLSADQDTQSRPQEDQLPTVVAIEQERTRSNSPVRTAHFAPVVGSNLTVRRHSPPPRSISPRKSAMKQSTSPRDASPSDSASEANPISYQSPNDLAIVARKKSNRVSFDDKAVVVSQAPVSPSPPLSPGLSTLPGASEASPNSNAAHQSPSRSRSWFSNIGRSKKKSGGDLADADLDDDVVMKPRPALPSFGSVRDKPHQAQPEERALVRPANDGQQVRQLTQSPPPPSASTAPPLETLSTSSDHAIGSIIAAGHQVPSLANRNTANTSRFREPLPPVVTSVDGSGYVSDSGDSISSNDDADAIDDGEANDDVEEHSPVLRFDEAQETTVPASLPVDTAGASTIAPGDANEEAASLSEPTSPTKSPKKTVPAIAVSHPSQENLVAIRGTEGDEEEDGAEDRRKASGVAPVPPSPPSPKKYSPVRALFDVPGTFPQESDSDSTPKSTPTRPTFGLGNTSNSPVPIRQNTFEPITQEDDLTYSPQMPATVFATHMPTLHEETSLRNEKMAEDDTESEVFSDAYEDLSDIEGDGFLSLDAVVDSPIVPDMATSLFGPAHLPGSPSWKSDVAQLGPSPLAKEVSPTKPAVSSSTATATTAAVGGVVVPMTALATSAIHKKLGGDSAVPEDEADWDKVKAFWRGLSAEKRAQLEQDAREDAAADGDLEEESTDVKKPRRKKSIETRIAEKKAIQESLPQQQAPLEPVEQRSQKQAATRVRQSLRDSPAAGIAGQKESVKTLRQKPKNAQQTTQGTFSQPTFSERERPMSFPPKAAVGAVSHTRTFSADSASSSVLQNKSGVSSLLPSALRRRGSDSSESSFKRARSSANGAGGLSAAGAGGAGLGFRTSMRADLNSTAAGTASDGLNHRSSRFSLRSLSPTGSTTLRGSTESSPQFRRTMRDGPGFAASDLKRMSSPAHFSSSTLRKGAASESNGGFFSSFGKKRGSKLLQRGKNGSGKATRTWAGDSSEDDDDIFGPTAAAGSSASARRSASAGAYTFRSRFVDSSDEDEIILDHRTVGSKQDKNHVVPKTLRSGGGMRSASARPASTTTTPKSPPLPEEIEEDEEDEELGNYTSLPYAAAATASSAARADENNIGTTTVRRSRSGRGQMIPMSPMYSPTTTGTVGLADGVSSPTQHRRAGSFMSVLRRKKHDGVAGGSLANGVNGSNKIQRAALVDSAARRDTQLERSTLELEAVRSTSTGSSQRRRALNKTLRSGGSTPRFVPQDDDSDEEDSEESPGGGGIVGGDSWPLPGPSNGNSLQPYTSASVVSEVTQEKKKKKFPALRRMFRLDD